MHIEIKETSALVQYEKNGVKYNKSMTLDTLISSLVSQCGVKTPRLPPGCRFYEKKGVKHVVLIEIPPIQRHIVYTNHGDKTIFSGVVPMPWGLLELGAMENNGRISVQGGRIFALKRPLLDDTDQIYHFPAANIHSSDNICWGSTFSNSAPFKSIADLGRAVDLYFSSEFNTDLHPHLNIYSRYEEMLRAIKDQKQFPNEILVPVNGMTYESLVRSL